MAAGSLRSWSETSQQVHWEFGWSSSGTFQVEVLPQIYLRKQHLFDRTMHDRNCLVESLFPAGRHNLPYRMPSFNSQIAHN